MAAVALLGACGGGSSSPEAGGGGNAPLPPETGYPAQWVWASDKTIDPMPRAATDDDGFSPRIEQVRAGRVIAVYTRLGGTNRGSAEYDPNAIDTSAGAFSRMPYRRLDDGDLFLVYPAVYRGEDQQPWIGPLPSSAADFAAGRTSVPARITIRGVTVGGVRPVIRMDATSASNNTLGQAPIYVDQSLGVTIENIDVDGTGARSAGKAGVYVNGATDLTLRDMRIHGFRAVSANGVFGTGNNAGTLRLERLRLYDNGGDSGPEHNVYINASETDPGFTVAMSGSWSYDVYFGHLFKSRAQRNVLEANYFMGASAAAGGQAESYLVDIPDGGELTMTNNVLAKNRSGAGSNGNLLSYGVESFGARTHGLDIRHNSFVSFGCTYDGLHTIAPLYTGGFDPRRPPIGMSIAVEANLLAGFCDVGAISPLFGASNTTLPITAIAQDFSATGAPAWSASTIVGTDTYAHANRFVARTAKTVGAID